MITYSQSGVNIDAGNKAVKLIKKLAKSTYSPDVLSGIGGFSALFKIDFKTYKNPILVSSTDGVGTKLKIAFALNKHDTIGMDLVAMCVNDIITSGARPLFFLDYFACGKLHPEKFQKVVKGIAKGCKIADCSLIGGETAELPGLYKEDEYDLAGFCVGVVEKENIIDGKKIKAKDKIIGLASSGLHSNGYSLARKVLFEVGKFKLTDYHPQIKKTMGEDLLTPTYIYSVIILDLISKFKIKGIAHITGGGLLENIPRILPEGLKAKIIKGTWKIPPIFNLIQSIGKIEEEEMYQVFNMGIGMVVIVKEEEANFILNFLKKQRQNAGIIGEIVKGEKKVEIC